MINFKQLEENLNLRLKLNTKADFIKYKDAFAEVKKMAEESLTILKNTELPYQGDKGERPNFSWATGKQLMSANRTRPLSIMLFVVSEDTVKSDIFKSLYCYEIDFTAISKCNHFLWYYRGGRKISKQKLLEYKESKEIAISSLENIVKKCSDINSYLNYKIVVKSILPCGIVKPLKKKSLVS